MPRDDRIVFSSRAHGVYIDNPWPKFVLIADEFLAAADRRFVNVDDDKIVVTINNGRGEYVRTSGGVEGAARYRRVAHTYLKIGAANHAA